MSGSLAYRKNEAAIIRGEVPDKYLRILPFVEGTKILELGSAEGVLALMLAKRGKSVIALEKNEERHHNAIKLYAEWIAHEEKFISPTFVNGSIENNVELLSNIDTLVAVRMIYYLREKLDSIFTAIAIRKVPRIVLCGNRNRANRFRSGVPDDPGGPFNYYASREGMRELLVRHGYSIAAEGLEGDEIVVGVLD